MTIEEIQNLQLGDELIREDGAIGFMLLPKAGHHNVYWVDRQGGRTIEIVDSWQMIPWARNPR